METQVHPRMIKARAKLITGQPFFGTLALHLNIEERQDIATMATDGKSLFYNIKFLDTLSDDEAEFVVAHEALHCAWLHHTRRQERDPFLWNVACDYVINSDLVKAGFRAPPGVLLDYQYDGLGSEDVYAILKKQEEEAEKDGKGKGKLKPGQGKADQMSRCGEVLDAAPDGSKAENGEQEAEWQTIAKQAVAVATKQHGSTPGFLERLVKEMKVARQDWREILRRFVDQCSTYDYSWSRGDRRFSTAPFILPGIIKDGIGHIAVAIDTSGSIDGAALALFRAECQAILDEGAVDQITVLYCDARVHNVEEFHSGDIVKFNPQGGGGTSFSPVWRYIEDNQLDVSACVYFTDLYGDFGVSPHYPVLWAAYGDPRQVRNIHVPFGEMVEVGT